MALEDSGHGPGRGGCLEAHCFRSDISPDRPLIRFACPIRRHQPRDLRQSFRAPQRIHHVIGCFQVRRRELRSLGLSPARSRLRGVSSPTREWSCFDGSRETASGSGTAKIGRSQFARILLEGSAFQASFGSDRNHVATNSVVAFTTSLYICGLAQSTVTWKNLSLRGYNKRSDSFGEGRCLPSSEC